jgi:hypothetical protein
MNEVSHAVSSLVHQINKIHGTNLVNPTFRFWQNIAAITLDSKVFSGNSGAVKRMSKTNLLTKN